jgi:AraC-like DNA-binding protein
VCGGGGGVSLSPEDPYAKAADLRSLADFLHTPFLCFGPELAGETVSAAVDAHIRSEKKRTILFIGIDGDLFGSWLDRGSAVHIPGKEYLADAVSRAVPSLIVLDSIDIEAIEAARSHPATAMTPIIAVPKRIQTPEEVEKLCRYPYILLCNRSVADRGEFSLRARAIAAGDAILPPYTGALVKKVLLYFNQHAESYISRWKVADTVNISEDYLTRIFHREMGCSLWEYLNQYRVSLAAELLTHTGDTIYEIAMKTGFQDQAYFCRVFKKIYGKAPGQLRASKRT